MTAEANLKPAWSGAVAGVLQANKDRPGALLPILHGIQEKIGYVPDDAVPVIAEELNLSRAEVHGVVSFYHEFRTHAPGRHVLKICEAESCQSLGAEHLVRHACSRLGIEMHQTSSDGAVTLEPIYCLGLCMLSPALMVDGEVHGRVSPEKLDGLLEDLRRKP
jgi:formate dehydrogenase subunit gamma